MKLKKGMIVTGTSESDRTYSITNSSMTKGLVVNATDDTIRVRVLEHQKNESIGSEFDVAARFFYPIENVPRLIVKTQDDWDAIPANFEGVIEFDNGENWVFIKESKGYAILASGCSQVKADNATVRAWGNATVRAWGNATVEAWGNATVEAWGNATVRASGNVQIVDQGCDGTLTVFANARIVFLPRNLQEFLTFHRIVQKDGKAILYKAVHGDDLHSDRDPAFKYAVGETRTQECDPDVSENCGTGLHVATLQWALDFGHSWADLRIIEVEAPIEKIVFPAHSSGKVRTSELKVRRVVPLEECGVWGKTLAKRQAKTNG